MEEEEKKSIEAWSKELQDLTKAEKWKCVAETAEICMVQHPKSYIGYNFAIFALKLMKKNEEAANVFQKSLENKIVHQEILLNIYSVITELANKTKLENLEELLTQVYDSEDEIASEFFWIRGIIRAKLSDFDGSVKDLTHFLDENPGHISALNYRGAAYYDLGQYKLGLVDLDTVIHSDKKSQATYLNRANIYAAMRRNVDALSDYGKALALDANYTKAYINRGLTFYDINCFAEGVEDFENALRLEPNNQEVIINLIYGYDMLGKAQKVFQTLQSIDDQDLPKLNDVNEKSLEDKLKALGNNFDIIKNHLPNRKPDNYYDFLLFLMALYGSTLENSVKYLLLTELNCEPSEVEKKLQGRNTEPNLCINLIKNLLQDSKLKEWLPFFGQNKTKGNRSSAIPFYKYQEARKIRNDIIHGNGSSNGSSSWNKMTRVKRSQCIYACFVMLEFLSKYLELFQNEIIRAKFNPLEGKTPSRKRHEANKMSKRQTKYFLDGLYAASNN